jgi:aminoglycoside phosphotransferase (APT) family kinase protein
MTTGHQRDDHVIASGLASWMGHRYPHRTIGGIELRRPTAGWSNETVLVSATVSGRPERFVVRLPPLVASYPDHDLHAQAEVQSLLAQTSVPVPAVIAVEDDAGFLGAPFLVMQHVDGRVPGQAPGLDPWLTEASHAEQRRVQDGFVSVLADLHGFDAGGAAVTSRLRRGMAAEIAYWSAYVDWSSDGDPPRGLADALEWCTRTSPSQSSLPGPDVRASLLWGDARLGNVMYDDDRRIVAVLDWELASIGPAEMDVAWYLALDELTTKAVGASVPGFRGREALLQRYRARLGRDLDHLPWHEIFALVRSIAINDKQARLAAAAGVAYPGLAGDDNPMLRYLARRIDRYRA